MCKKLNELCGMTPAKIIEEYAKDKDSYAIDVYDILRQLKIPFYEYDFSQINVPLAAYVTGAVVLRGDDLDMFVSKKCSDEEQRFIVAHELGHCCLHRDALKDNRVEFSGCPISEADKQHEAEADRFAMELLIPEGALQTVRGLLIRKRLEFLAECFGVTSEVMRKRHEMLQLDYD